MVPAAETQIVGQTESEILFDKEDARRIAARASDGELVVDPDGAREIAEGWYFPYRAMGEPQFGSNGLIVNKASGEVFRLGSAFSLQRDLEMYDRGYQFKRYDLVIIDVADLEATVGTLLEIGLRAVEPTYEHGSVWRVPRPLTRGELTERLRRLPYVFGNVSLYFRLEALERARAAGTFRFEALRFGGVTAPG